MKYFDNLFQSYKDAYKKSRYWFSILYILLSIQVWMRLTIPGEPLLKTDQNLVWLQMFLNYYENTFNPDSAQAKSVVIINSIKDQFKFSLQGGFVKPPDTSSIYFKTITSLSDSLLYYDLINVGIDSTFPKTSFSHIQKSVVKFRKEHNRRDDSLKTELSKLNKDISSERGNLFEKDKNEFQKILDQEILSLFEQRVEYQLLNSLSKRLNYISSDSIITYHTLIVIDLEEIKKKNEFLNTNIIKTPYIDLPLKARWAISLILIISVLVYFYFTVLIKYFSDLENMMESYSFPKAIMSPSIKNIILSLGLIPISKKWDKWIAFFFYTLLPLVILFYFNKYLWAFGTDEFYLIMSLIIVVKILIWSRLKPKSFWLQFKTFKKSL